MGGRINFTRGERIMELEVKLDARIIAQIFDFGRLNTIDFQFPTLETLRLNSECTILEIYGSNFFL